MEHSEDDDILNQDDDYDDGYEIGNEEEEALLKEDDFDDKGEESKEKFDNEDDVLDLDIEEDFKDDDDKVDDSFDDDHSRRRENKFFVERNEPETTNNKNNNDSEDKKAPFYSKQAQQQQNNNTNMRKNYPPRGELKYPPRGEPNRRGNFRNKFNSNRPGKSFTDKRRNGTVLINPRFRGAVHLNDNDAARLAWDSHSSNQTAPLIQPWSSSAIPQISPEIQTQEIFREILSNLPSVFQPPPVQSTFQPPPQLSFQPPVQQHSVFEPPPPPVQHNVFQPPPNYKEASGLSMTHQPPPSYQQQPVYHQWNEPPQVGNFNQVQQRQPDTFQRGPSFRQEYPTHQQQQQQPFFDQSKFSRPPPNLQKPRGYNQGSNYYPNESSRNAQQQNQYNYSMTNNNNASARRNNFTYKKNDFRPTYKQINHGQERSNFPISSQSTKEDTRKRTTDENLVFRVDNTAPVEKQQKFDKSSDNQWDRKVERDQRFEQDVKLTNEPVRNSNEEIEEDEDEQTRLYRLKILEQKRKREQILKMKEERRLLRLQQENLDEQVQPSSDQHNPTDSSNNPSRVPYSHVKPITITNTRQNLVRVEPQRNTVTLSKNLVRIVDNHQPGDVARNNQNNVTRIVNQRRFDNSSSNVRRNANNQSLNIVLTRSNRQPVEEVSNFEMTVENDLAGAIVPVQKQPTVKSGFMTNRVVLVKNNQSSATVSSGSSSSSGGPLKLLTDNTSGGAGDIDHLSSFLCNRKILSRDPGLLKTRLVVLNNLSASTGESALVNMCRGIGEIQKLHMDRHERQATILFKTVAVAHAFYKKYQRHMLDLSMIDVRLEPMI